MQLADLKTSITKLDFNEAILLIGRIRESRRAPKTLRASPKVAKAKKENKELRAALAGLSPDQLQDTINELMRIAEGKTSR